MKEVKVKGCSDCPFAIKSAENGYFYCEHPDGGEFIDDYRPKEPIKSCPLLTEPITIKLDKDETAQS